MREFKGYQIPDTYEEICNYVNENMVRNPMNPAIPTLMYKINDSAYVSIPITIENFFGAEKDETKNTMVSSFVEAVTKYIDNKDISENVQKSRNKKLENYTFGQILDYCLHRCFIGGCDENCKMWNFCNTIRNGGKLSNPELLVNSHEQVNLYFDK